MPQVAGLQPARGSQPSMQDMLLDERVIIQETLDSELPTICRRTNGALITSRIEQNQATTSYDLTV